MPKEASPEFRTELLKQLRGDFKQRKALACHQLFKQLRGNPTSIQQLAAQHSNPLSDSTLPELYQKMLENKKYADAMDNQDSIEGRPKIGKNNYALNLFTETTI